ncbi:cyclodeaminase/cyclohydrolase family protein [Acetohalobium arabaticum]|uniref:Formiminotransferase-cyclodeaminase n=1 Tax=Acetohalobium arabaticum (strain ATCC 49924 / DSM 5501 / Z-7288) TaxID=574087 RepID=D9QSH8_ACEAZ|nr:cyclodeaminase/cyclohydrolase family protein [Acetohalobium arabaticum]ADL13441.1 Formiminotransferase-cyclodeaminase [Acetohalobium arabaticum DSM 5501]
MSFADYSIDEFTAELASDAATPGGGSVAGLCGSLSASLIAMVIRLTKENDLDHDTAELEELQIEALELIDEDSESFDQVMAAFKLPKETEEEQEKRSRAIQEAMKEAAITPLETMKLGLELLKIAVKVVREGNANAVSDAGVAGLLALDAVKGGRYNVLINAESLTDEADAGELKDKSEEILAEAEELAAEIERIAEERILG